VHLAAACTFHTAYGSRRYSDALPVHNSIHIVSQAVLQDVASLVDIIKQLHILLSVYVGFIGQAFRIAVTEQADTCRQAGMLDAMRGLDQR